MTRGDLIEEFLAEFWARNPVTATFAGVHAYDAQLPDWTPDGLATEAHCWRAWLARLDEPAPDWPVLAHDSLQLDRYVARSVAAVRLAELESGHFVARNPALWTGEAIFGAVALLLRDFAPAAERVAPLVQRLEATPAFLQAMRTSLVTPLPATWVARAQRECAAAVTLLTDSLPRWASSEGVAASDTLNGAAARAAMAFRDASAWLAEQATTDAVACGEALLQQLLRDGHHHDESPRDLLARVEAALPAALAALATALTPFGGSLTTAREAMAADHPSASDFLPEFGARWHAVRDAVVAADVVCWPDAWPLRYVPIPEWARAVQPALYFLFYRSPAPFDAYTEHPYLVAPVDAHTPAEQAAPVLRAWNRSVIGTNHVLHHGGIGHHVQNYAAVHGSSRIGRVAAVDAASRIAMFQGGSMAEGWACYATQLAGELGLLTPLEQLSEAHSAIRFLGRAVIDLRLHLGDWSAERCAGFLTEVVGVEAVQAAGEVTKASMFPGTALMYWLGTSEIVAVRAALMARQGARFSRRRFHDALLSRGSLPVPLVARLLLATEGA